MPDDGGREGAERHLPGPDRRAFLSLPGGNFNKIVDNLITKSIVFHPTSHHVIEVTHSPEVGAASPLPMHQ
jgi:hypothetical protein